MTRPRRASHRRKIRLGLCGYATGNGVDSDREIAWLVEPHAAYRWQCGGGAVVYHRVDDFRSDHGDVFSGRLTQLLARLMQHDVIDPHRSPSRRRMAPASAPTPALRRSKR